VPSPQNRRRALVIADQAASSLSNVVVAVLVARSFPDEVEPFAAFSLAIMVFQFLVGGVRGLVFEPVLSLYADDSFRERRAILPGYLGATVGVGVVLAALVGGAGLVIGGLVGSALAALAVVLPAVLVQDAWRYMFLVDRPRAGLAIDVIWLASSCVAIVLVPAGSDVGWYVGAWGAGGALGALAATALGQCIPAPSRGWTYLVNHRELGWRFLLEFGTSQAAFYASLLGCGLILGLDDYGAVRAGYLFIGPLLTLQAGILLSVLPEGVRLRDQPGKLMRLALGGSGLIVAATIGWTIVGLSMPDSAGTALFGPTWFRTDDILIPIGMTMAATGLISGGLVGVRSLDGTKGIGARLRSIPFQLVCPLVGALSGGLVGFTLGLALGQASAAAVWWSTLVRMVRGRSSVPEQDAVGATSAAAQ
jgi:hypothetical protein